MSAKTQRKPLKFDRNPIESIREGSSDIAKVTARTLQDEAKLDSQIAWRQFFGITESAKNSTKKIEALDKETHDLQEGEELILSTTENKARVAPGIDYVAEILHAERRFSADNNRQLNVRIEELRIEIAKLAKSSKQLEMVVKDVSIETIGSSAGKYHLNFFEWVLTTIKTARIRIEDSTNWLTTVSSKSRKKDYWSLAKKHGTTYMLSGERVVAQQTG